MTGTGFGPTAQSFSSSGRNSLWLGMPAATQEICAHDSVLWPARAADGALKLVGNALNGYYFDNLAGVADREELEHIVLAVAFVRDLGPIADLARKRGVPLTLYALADGEGGFPSLEILRLFVTGSSSSWQLFLTRRFYHPKVAWFRGVGCYIGSANLTDGGRMSNLECGVWLEEEELRRENWDQELAAMLAVVRERSAAAIREDIDRFERLQRARAPSSSGKRSRTSRISWRRNCSTFLAPIART